MNASSKGVKVASHPGSNASGAVSLDTWLRTVVLRGYALVAASQGIEREKEKEEKKKPEELPKRQANPRLNDWRLTRDTNQERERERREGDIPKMAPT